MSNSKTIYKKTETMNLELERFLENQTEMLGNLTINDSIDVETLTDICEEYHKRKIKSLGVANINYSASGLISKTKHLPKSDFSEELKLSKESESKFTLILFSSDEVGKKVKVLLDKGRKFDEIKFKKDLQMDSLDAVALVMLFEQHFDCCIPDDKIHKVKTIGDAKQILANCLIGS